MVHKMLVDAFPPDDSSACEEKSSGDNLDHLAVLSHMVTDYRSSLQLLSDREEFGCLVAPIRDDFEHMIAVASAAHGGLGVPSTDVVSAAMKHVDTPEMAGVKTAMGSNCLGRIVMSKAAVVLQLSAKDKAADQKCARARFARR